jgi:hypothetical protein
LVALVSLTPGIHQPRNVGCRAYANAELPCQAPIETLVASGIEAEANSKNAILTQIIEDTIMLAKSNTFGYLSGPEVQGVANIWPSGPPCLLPLDILRRYIAKTIDHPQIQQYSPIRDTIWLMLHSDLSSVR